jgi:transcriptional regulator with XRE-family HTH domain
VNREKIKNDLRMFINKHGLRQEDIGKLTGTSSSTISRILRGIDGVTDEIFETIEEALEILKDQDDDQIEDQVEDQTLKNDKSKNKDHLSFEANGTRFKHDKKNKCLYVKNKDIDLKITLI